MTSSEVCRYLELVNRRLYILLNLGVNWKPQYEAELECIDRELATLRRIVDREHRRKEAAGNGKADHECSGCYVGAGSI